MNREFNIVFSDEELGAVLTAIQELPYKVSAPLINKIQNQIQQIIMAEQNKTEEEAEVKEEEK